MRLISLFLLCVFFASCDSKPQGPHETLARFVDYRFSQSQTKEGLLHFMTAKASEEISAMSEENLAALFKVDNYRKRNFKVITEKCTEDKCFMTYTLEYDVLAANNTREFVAEVKKIAELQKINQEWKVANIDNIKTFIDSTKAIDVK